MERTSPQTAQIKVRLPADLKEWLVQQHKANERTQNGELVHILRQYRKQQGTAQ